jgi:hypothetical protein
MLGGTNRQRVFCSLPYLDLSPASYILLVSMRLSVIQNIPRLSSATCGSRVVQKSEECRAYLYRAQGQLDCSAKHGCPMLVSLDHSWYAWHVVEVEVNLRLTDSQPVCPGVRRPSGTCDQFFFRHEISFRHLRLWYFVAPSLTRGRVCNLLLNCLWALPEHSLLRRKSRRTHGPIFTVSSETFPTWRARFPYLYPPGTGWPSYTPGHWVPFQSPLTARGDYGGGILTRVRAKCCNHSRNNSEFMKSLCNQCQDSSTRI